MKRRLFIMLMGGAALGGISTLVQAASREVDKEHIFGSELMTEEERNEYRERLRTAKTEQEREQIRSEHRNKMQECARDRGVTMKEKPPAGGRR